jgi:hypothetical protein
MRGSARLEMQRVVKLRSDHAKGAPLDYIQWRPVATNRWPVPALLSLQSASIIELEGELELSRRVLGTLHHPE